MKAKFYKLIREVVTPTFKERTESITTLEEGMRIKADWLGRDRWRHDNLCRLKVKNKVYTCKDRDWFSKVHLIPLSI